jgi:ATP-dependent Clp protease ATP-binding subunit ClpA
MFERFSEMARQAIVEGQSAARELGHPFIAPEHLLLGLVKVGAAGEVSAARVTEEVVGALGPPAGDTTGQIPFTPRAQRALERAIERTAKTITPAHVLHALLENEDVAAILERCGADPGKLEPLQDDDDGHPVEVTLGDELIGDLGNPRTDVRVIGAILRADGRAAGWLRASGVDEAWVREFGG